MVRRWLQPALAGFLILCTLTGWHEVHAQELLVGQVASQSSPVTSANAKGMALGMQAYFSSVNDKGGVAGRPVKLVTKDDGLVPAKMVDLTREFIADKNVIALAGYINTGGLTALVKDNVVGEAGIAMISPLQGDKAIVSASNFFPFRSGYSDEVTALVKEAKSTQKQRVALVYWNVTFGPDMVKLAQDLSKEIGLTVLPPVSIDAKDQAKFEPEVEQAANAVIKQAPDAVIMLISGRYAQEFIKKIRNSPAESTQLYAMSIVPAGDVVKTVGIEKARGVVIAQAVPYPYSPGRPLVSEYQKIMKQYAPNEPYSFSTLEGFVTAKITVEALKRAGPAPTREKVLRALTSMGEFNLGDVYINYSPTARRGWGRIDLTIINAEGRLVR